MTATGNTCEMPITEFLGGPLDGDLRHAEPADELRTASGHVYRYSASLSSRRARRVMVSEHLTAGAIK